MNLRDLLEPLDSVFKSRRILYAVIGGYAVAAWGEVRATRDVDLLCSTGDLFVFKDALSKAGLPFEHRSGDPDDPISDVIRIEMRSGADLCEIDVLFGIRGAPPGILERACTVQVAGLPVPIASPEDMVILKLLAGSARDLEDAGNILQVQRDRLNLDLIRQLCPEHLNDTLTRLQMPRDGSRRI